MPQNQTYHLPNGLTMTQTPVVAMALHWRPTEPDEREPDAPWHMADLVVSAQDNDGTNYREALGGVCYGKSEAEVWQMAEAVARYITREWGMVS